MVKNNAHKSVAPIVRGLLCLLLLAMSPAAGLFAADAAAGATSKSQASAKDLVGQLGGDSYKGRENAQKALIAMGADALDAVAAGAKSTDPETRARCEQILTRIQKNLLASRTETVKKSIVWKSPLNSAPVGATVVCKGLALLVDTEGVLHVLDLAAGKEQWHSDARLGRFTSAGPAVDGATAYLTSGSVNAAGPGRFITALDVAGGKVLWQTDLKENKDEISPPAVAEGVVYVCGNDQRDKTPQPGGPAAVKNPGTYFEALDAKNGKSLWKLPIAGLTVSRPVVGKELAFARGEDLKVHAIDLKAHKETWTSEAFKNAVLAMRVDGERLLAQSSTALVAIEAGTGKQAWKLDLPGDTANERVINGMTIKMRVSVNGQTVAPGQGERTFCVDDGIAYVPCGQKVWAVETKSGQKQWEYEAQQDNPQGNPGLNGGRVMVAGGGQIIINGNGRMIINGVTFGGGAGQDYQPVVAGSAIYYGAPDGLHAVDLRTRQETWVLHTAGAICTRPVVAEGVIYFGVAVAAPAPAADAGPQGEKLPALFAVKLPVK